MEHIIPTNSILSQTVKEDEENLFQSVFIEEKIKEHKKKKEIKEKKVKQELSELFECCICLGNLKDPLYSPLCQHCACRECFRKIMETHKSNRFPCPLCRRIIRYSSLLELPLANRIEEILNEKKTNKGSNIEFTTEELIENCENHTYNKVCFYCIDCKQSICPVCVMDGSKIHEEHRLINYKRYLDFNIYLKGEFKGINDSMNKAQEVIQNYQDFSTELEKQKTALLDFIKDMKEKILKNYKLAQEKLNEKIGILVSKVNSFKNIKKNIKINISSSIPKGVYNFENMEQIKNEIKDRLSKVDLKIPNKREEILLLEKNFSKKKAVLNKKENKITLRKEDILKDGKMQFSLKYNKNYIFTAELSEDKKTINIFLDIKTTLNGQQNNNSYLVGMNFFDTKGGNKSIYLNYDDNDEGYYSFQGVIPFNELFDGQKDTSFIEIYWYSFTFEEK